MWRFFALFVIGLMILMWMTQIRAEGFADMRPEDLPDPRAVFKELRALLDRFENTELLDAAVTNRDKDPGQLARAALGIANDA